MAYTTSGITNVTYRNTSTGVIVEGQNDNTDKVVQIYLSGTLYDYQNNIASAFHFELPQIRSYDIIFLLAVDVDEQTTNYWDDAFGVSDTYGNKLKFTVYRLTESFVPTDKLKAYISDTDEASADIKIYEELYYPGGVDSGGFGFGFGSGGYGWNGDNGIGFGYYFGQGEYGIDCDATIIKTDALINGVYKYELNTEDAVGNESSGTTGQLTINSYARPATGLTVEAYDSGTDALELSFTASPDIS